LYNEFGWELGKGIDASNANEFVELATQHPSRSSTAFSRWSLQGNKSADADLPRKLLSEPVLPLRRQLGREAEITRPHDSSDAHGRLLNARTQSVDAIHDSAPAKRSALTARPRRSWTQRTPAFS
jgi:hypothetical protein